MAKKRSEELKRLFYMFKIVDNHYSSVDTPSKRVKMTFFDQIEKDALIRDSALKFLIALHDITESERKANLSLICEYEEKLLRMFTT